jgi:N-acetylmuramoyl-L-alanine amidase
LTRDSDSFVTLDNRDKLAVAQKADLFLSIHANAAPRRDANGIEIYYLNNATDVASRRLADRENAGSRKSRSTMEEILSNILLNDSTVFSRMLAEEIQKTLKDDLVRRYPMDRLEIKSALFYVLVGSKAPSILLEVGFVTNPQEARRLSQAEYQNHLVRAVTKGVAAYFKMLESKKLAM